MLLRNVKLCLRHSEIIHYADSEITAACGGSDEERQPKGLRKDNTLGGRRLAVDPCCQSSNFTGSHETISPGARRISLWQLGQNFTADTQ